jgi:hypothetical protein
MKKLFLLFGLVLSWSFSFSQQGTTCDNPIPLAGPGDYTGTFEDTWYTYTPTESGITAFSTCGTNSCDTKIWIYSSCVANPTEFAEGTYAYNDDFCGLQAHLEVNLIAGTTYYVRIGDYYESCTASVNFNITYIGQIYGCTDATACNFNPMATADDGSCVYFPSDACSQPDLRFDSLALVNSLYVGQILAAECDVQEGCVTGYGNRWIIGFSSKIDNIGEADYYIGNPSANPEMFSVVNCHGHTHYEGYGDYRLMDENGDLVPVGHKNGFCVMDLCGMGQYNCSDMGISSGCYDIYGAGTQCQWLDITEIPAGQYRFVALVNPYYLPDALGRYESNTQNNAVSICMEIFWNNGVPTFQLLPDCPTYIDCAGNINGSAELDCNGVCNGPSVFGDVNADSDLNGSDVVSYLGILAQETIQATTCNDLNANGEISVYDIYLAQWCMNGGNGGSTITNACDFPRNIVNVNTAAGLSISNFSAADGYIDVELISTMDDVTGYQFEISGADVIGVSSLIDPTVFSCEVGYNAFSEGVFVVSNVYGNKIENSLNPTQLCRVYLSNFEGNEICIDEVVDIVNNNAERLPSYVYGSCVQLVSVDENSSLVTASTEVYPNPASNEIRVRVNALSEGTTHMAIQDATGRTVKTISSLSLNVWNTLEISDLSTGVYTIHPFNQAGSGTAFRFVKL